MLIIGIIAALLIVLLLYPIRIEGDVRYAEGHFQGWFKIFPLFLLPKPAISLWDSERPEKEEKNKEKIEEKTAQAEKKEKQKKEWSKDDVVELLPGIWDIVSRAYRGIKRFPLRIGLQYSLGNPAHTAEIYGLIFALLPLIFGDMRKLRWRIRIDPIWVAEELCFFTQMKLTMNLLLVLFAFASSIGKVLKLIWKIVRRRKHERSSHRTPDYQRVGES